MDPQKPDVNVLVAWPLGHGTRAMDCGAMGLALARTKQKRGVCPLVFDDCFAVYFVCCLRAANKPAIPKNNKNNADGSETC